MPPEAENNGTPTPQAGEGNQPQAGAPTTPQAGDGETISLEEARKLRTEAQQLRQRAKAAEDKLNGIEAQSLTELQKAQKAATDHEAAAKANADKYVSASIRYGVMLAAGRAGIVDPDAAYKLLDTTGLDPEDKGFDKEVEKRLKELTDARTWLVGTPPAGGSSAGKPATKGTAAFTREDVAKMTTAEITANYDAIQTAMKTWPAQ